MPFLRPISDRYFEDYLEGEVHRAEGTVFGRLRIDMNRLWTKLFGEGDYLICTDRDSAKALDRQRMAHRRSHDLTIHGTLSHQGGELGLSRRR
jgi:hypothetical protein